MRLASWSMCMSTLVGLGLLPQVAWAQEQEVAPEAVQLDDKAEEPVASEPVELDEEPPAIGAQAGGSASGGVSAGDEDVPVVQLQSSTAGGANANADTTAGVATPARTFGGPTTDADSEWKANWFGFFRAPMRIGIGDRSEQISTPVNRLTFLPINRFAGDPTTGAGSNQEVFEGQSNTTFSNPIIPDDQFLGWQHTTVNERAWAEFFFNYGNSFASGTLAIQGFNFTDSGFNDQDAQFGITQGYVTLTPDTEDILEDSLFWLRVGSFWNLYGQPGKYDAGFYDTYLSGKTHTIGFTYHPEIQLESARVWFEHGFGTRQPHPDVAQNTLFTLLHHAHLGLSYEGWLDLELHYLDSFTKEPAHFCIPGPLGAPNNLSAISPGSCDQGVGVPTRPGSYRANNPVDTEPPDGSLKILGADVTADFGSPGRLFVGGSLINASAAETVDAAVEVIHAFGGGFYNSGIVGQYFVPTTRLEAAGSDNLRGRGYGSVTSLGVQYNLNISGLAPEAFGGNILDLGLFALWNKISLDIDEINTARAVSSLPVLTPVDESFDGHTRLKYGADLEFSPVEWFAAGLRYDRLQPNSEYPEQAFTIISPRLVFRTAFATHEEITLGYSRYIYEEQTCLPTATPGSAEALQCVQAPSGPVFPDGFGAYPGLNQSAAFRGSPSPVPHEQTVRLVATMWW